MGVVKDTLAFKDPAVLADTLIWSPMALDAAMKGDADELSLGFTFDLQWTAGAYEGQAYDAIQTNLVAHHLALVGVGRAGPEIALKLKAA